jgi:hypothetical protein
MFPSEGNLGLHSVIDLPVGFIPSILVHDTIPPLCHLNSTGDSVPSPIISPFSTTTALSYYSFSSFSFSLFFSFNDRAHILGVKGLPKGLQNVLARNREEKKPAHTLETFVDVLHVIVMLQWTPSAKCCTYL